MLLPAFCFYPAIINKHIVKLNFNQPHPIVYVQTMCHIHRFKVWGFDPKSMVPVFDFEARSAAPQTPCS